VKVVVFIYVKLVVYNSRCTKSGSCSLLSCELWSRGQNPDVLSKSKFRGEIGKLLSLIFFPLFSLCCMENITQQVVDVWFKTFFFFYLMQCVQLDHDYWFIGEHSSLVLFIRKYIVLRNCLHSITQCDT